MDDKNDFLQELFEDHPFMLILSGIGVGLGMIFTASLGGLGYMLDIKNKSSEIKTIENNKEEK